ncbi:MAG: stage II sporulation protein M [Thermoflexales bacterium]
MTGKAGGNARLKDPEARQLGALYQAASGDLAVARRDFPAHAVTLYLNQLVGAAHARIYRGQTIRWSSVADFYRLELPRIFRRLAPYIAVAALLFFGSAILVFLIVQADPAAARPFVDQETESMIRDQTAWWQNLNGRNQLGAARIMTNNLRVSLLAFAGGLSGGLFTLYITLMNGLDLGAVFGLSAAIGNPWPLAEFVVGHGVLELNEIIFSSACGLAMGHALLRPGLLSRRDALMLAAQQAIRFMLGTAPLLVVAGLIEGFVSPAVAIPFAAKAAIGAATGIALYAWLGLSGASPRKA